MQNEHEVIMGVINELLSSSLGFGANKVTIDYEDLGAEIKVEVRDNGKGLGAQELKRVLELLNQPRRTEIEDYYGHLAGEWMAGSGMNLVGMMVDRAEVESGPGGTCIKVYRKKNE